MKPFGYYFDTLPWGGISTKVKINKPKDQYHMKTGLTGSSKMCRGIFEQNVSRKRLLQLVVSNLATIYRNNLLQQCCLSSVTATCNNLVTNNLSQTCRDKLQQGVWAHPDIGLQRFVINKSRCMNGHKEVVSTCLFYTSCKIAVASLWTNRKVVEDNRSCSQVFRSQVTTIIDKATSLSI